MNAHFVACALALLLAACAAPPPPATPTPATPIPLTPPAEQATAPVVRRELAPAPAASIPPSAPQVPPPTAAVPPVVLPADAIYVCVVDQVGIRRQTVIELGPKVLALCKRHPEMGPCQYERNVCRAAGGRVFAANGQEITLVTEAEYDKKVLRVRFRAN